MKNNPPVSEIALLVQYPKVAAASVLDAASFFDLFKNRFPVFQQAARLAPLPVPQPLVEAQEGQPPTPPQVAMNFAPMDGSALPRILAISSDLKRLIQFQDDRFGFNWRRIVPFDQPSNYPGFDVLHAEFLALFQEFSAWYKDRFAQFPIPSVAELVYVNSVPLIFRGEKRRLSEIYKFFKPTNRTAVGGFTTNWAQSILGETPGHIIVNTAAGILADGTHAATATFTAHVSLAAVSNKPEKWFTNAHATVLEVFDSVIISDVNEGSSNASVH